MDVDAQLEALEEENDILKARIAQLEDVLGLGFLAPVEWRLTTSETCVFGVLLNRECATKDAILAALYRDHGKDEAEIKIVDAFICKTRKKLAPFGIQILTRWGVGYCLDAATKDRVRQMIADSAGQAA